MTSTLHDGNQLFQCLQSFLRRHVVNTTVSTTERSTTDHVVRSNSLRYNVYVKQCDDTFFTRIYSNQRDCMRTFSQSESTHVCCQVHKSTRYQVSVSNTVTEATRFRSIPTSIHKYPMFRLVPCPTLPNTVSTHFTPDETQRAAIKNTFFHQHPSREMMSATIPSQWNVLRPLTLVPSAQRNETMLTSVTQDQSSRRRALKAASSHKPNQYPYTAGIPSPSYSRGIVRIPCFQSML